MALIAEKLSPEERSLLAHREGQIKRGLESMDETIEALDAIRDKKLYRETHSSFDAYVQDKWGKTWRRLRQLAAGEATVRALQQGGTVVPVIPTHEAQVRSIATYPTPVKIEIWTNAVQSAGGQQPTAAQVETEKAKYLVYESKISPIIARMDKGDLAPAQALNLATAVQSCEPKVRGDLLLIDASDPAFMLEMNRIRTSDTYGEIVRSRYLQFVSGAAIPAAKATAADLRRLLDEKAREHRQNGSVIGQVHVVNLYEGDPARTFKTLLKTLHSDDMTALKEMFADYQPPVPAAVKAEEPITITKGATGDDSSSNNSDE